MGFMDRLGFFWTDDEGQTSQRRILGITWDELPAFAINTLEHVSMAYPENEPFEKEKIVDWLKHAIRKESEENPEMVTKDFAKMSRDPTIYESFLENTVKSN